jgi:hypothetical protein
MLVCGVDLKTCYSVEAESVFIIVISSKLLIIKFNVIKLSKVKDSRDQPSSVTIRVTTVSSSP